MTGPRSFFGTLLGMAIAVVAVTLPLAVLSIYYPPLQWMFLEGVLGISVQANHLEAQGVPRESVVRGGFVDESAARADQLQSILEDLRQEFGHGEGAYLLSRAYRLGDARQRLLAVQGFGRLPGAEGVAPLVQALADPSQEVHREAIAALERHPEARGSVLDYLRQGPDLRLPDAAVLLGSWGRTEDAVELIAWWELASYPGRGAIRASLERMDPATVRPALVKAFETAPPETASLGLELLARDPGNPGLEVLELGSRHGMEPVRRTACELLAERKGGFPPLVRAAAEDPSADVRRAAVDALGRRKEVEALPVLAGALEDANPSVRMAARRALSAQVRGERGEEALPVLEKLLRAQDANVRRGAAELLGELRGEKVVRALLPAAADPEAGVRQDAVTALGRAGASSEELARYLSDPDGNVLAVALGALGERKDAEALRAVAGHLDSPHPRVRAAAARATIRVAGASRAVEPLLARLENASPEALETLATALGRTRSRGAIDALLKLARAQEEAVRESAEAALIWIAEPGLREEIEAGIRGLPAGQRDSIRGRLGRP